MTDEFPRGLRAWRIHRGVTQLELAEATGTTDRTIQRFERGELVPRGDLLRRMAKRLDCRMEDLLPEEE